MLSASKSLVVGSIPGIGMVEKNFFFFIYYDFVVLETFGEILVLGSIPGVCMDIFLIFFSIWWCGGMSMVKKDVVAKPLRGG